MESFKPVAAPWWQTFYKNPVLQLVIFLGLIGGGGFYLYQKNRTTSTHNVASTSRSSVQVNSAKNFPPPPPPAPDVQPATNAEAPPPPPAFGSGVSVTESSSTNPPAAKLAADGTKTEELKKEARALAAKTGAGPHLKVYYAEVSNQALGGLIEASRGTGQFLNFADYSAGIIPDLDKRLHAPGVKVLRQEERNLDSGKTLQWSYGLKDRSNPSVEIGLTTFFALEDIDGSNLRGNLEVQRTWREPGPSGGFEVQRKSFPANFEIGSKTGFFMSGIMPTQSNLENDDELTSIDVYKILRSPQFRAGDSEFVIFVEYGK